MGKPEAIYINVAADFSKTPGPRSADEGRFAGDDFLNNLLLPRFIEAQRHKTKLYVDLDGVEGYATSFLESAFGGLARKFSAAEVLAVLEIKSTDEPYLEQEIRSYIKEVEMKSA